MFEVIRSETSADLVDPNVRLLAKAAKAFDWSFTEVPKLTDELGVAEAEKLAAQGTD